MTELLDLQTLMVFRFVRDFIRQQGMGPSHREIAQGTYMAATTMVIHLTRLEMRAWLYRDYNIPRSVRLGDCAPTDEQFDVIWASALALDDSDK